MKIEVGKKYRTREGEIVTIIGETFKPIFPYEADNYLTYTEEGRWF